MERPRYIYRERKLSADEALLLRMSQITSAMEHQAACRRALEEAKNELHRLHHALPPTSVTEQITLLPGDEGYDEAPVNVDPYQYQGDFAWVNPPKTDMLIRPPRGHQIVMKPGDHIKIDGEDYLVDENPPRYDFNGNRLDYNDNDDDLDEPLGPACQLGDTECESCQ